MEFTLEQRENYAGRCSDRHGSIEFEYYTRRQMRARYPSGGYAVSGEVGFVGKIRSGLRKHRPASFRSMFPEATTHGRTVSGDMSRQREIDFSGWSKMCLSSACCSCW